jgi:predicted alpha/beta hydrolase family esterase
MAARLWRWVLGVVLVFATTAAGALALTFALAAWTALWTALAILLATPVVFAAASLAAAHACNPRGWTWSAAGCALRAVPGEALHFSRAILRMSVDPRQPPASAALPAGRPPRPVLLIHGILCNRGVWRAVEPRLHAAGLAPVRAVNLEPLFADIELQARRVAPELLALQQQCDGARVIIVAHSMGGLVARALLRNVGSGAISRIVTLGSPHHGTMFTRGLPWPATQQMNPESPWLGALNTAQEGNLTVPVISIYSLDDNLVAPACSAQLRGAQSREICGVGHFGLLNSRRALDALMAALAPACPE